MNFNVKHIKIALFMGILGLLTACNLTNDVEIELPEYESQPVVECYLEPGKPFRLLLSRSYAFFDPLGLDSTFFERTLWQGATVAIEYDGNRVPLANQFSFEQSPLKLFNYTATQLVPATPGVQYTLFITLEDGREITGQTTMLPLVEYDSLVIGRSITDPTKYRMLSYISDDMTTANYYRQIFQVNNLDTIADQDFLVDDRFSTSNVIAFGTGFDFEAGDTLYNTIMHIDRPYFDYYESVQLAVQGAANPFAQPSPIKSNVTGNANPLGIFAPLVYDRRVTILE
jgi:Domain of unknown function (DUF4249)